MPTLSARVSTDARRHLYNLRNRVEDRLLRLGRRAANRVDQWTAPLRERGVPAPDLSEALDDALIQAVEDAIPEYEQHNVHHIRDHIRVMDSVDTLHAVAAWERAHKDRSTVARAVRRRLGQLQPELA